MSAIHDPFDSEWADRLASQAMRKWMQDHDWSTTFGNDPAELLAFLETHGDEADLEHFNLQINED